MRDWGRFIIIQKTRGLIGLPNPEEELRLLEEKANESYGKYKEALDVTANLESQLEGLKDEIEVELAKQQGVLAKAEQDSIALTAEVKAHSATIGVVKKDIEDIELAIVKVEQEKGNRDHTIKVLQDEIAEQDEVINKL